MIRECFNKFFYYFSKNKGNFIKYFLLSFIAGVLELFGVVLTYPFVIKLLSQNEQTSFLTSPIVMGLGIVFFFLAKNIFMIFYTYVQTKFVKTIEVEVNMSFMKYFLTAPYQETSKIPFAQKSNIYGLLIPNTINNFILRLLNLSVNCFIFFLISAFLVIKFPIAMLVTTICACIMISVQNVFFKPKLDSVSKQISEASALYGQKSNDVLLNLKGVNVSNNGKFFYENYKQAISNFFKLSSTTSFLNTIPSYVTEPLIIILLLVLLSIISIQSYTAPDRLLASFAIIVLAIFRLAPTISRIQTNLNGINSVKHIVQELLNYCEKFHIDCLNEINEPNFTEFKDKLELKNVCYQYENGFCALKNINLEIKKGDFIGIAGLSGAGKTTLVDVISGLLIPTTGEIFIDGELKSSKLLKIGYIPQEFNIINGTIKDNVTFGNSSIDDNRVIEVLKQAQLFEFIKENYKEGIEANPFVDSTGFSQGQKQRLAIARALYSNPDILILDEATSSLDLKTEDGICNVLLTLKGDKTIIAIAHRLSTIKSADKIIFMKNAEIVNISAFNNLINESEDFKELVKLASLK